MKIAIIGAGFAGLATAWYLLKRDATVIIFDSQGVGGGASGIAAGLCHGYPGAHAFRNPLATSALAETLHLLNVSNTAINGSVFENQGILRLAMNEEQKNDFAKVAEKYEDVVWQSAENCLKIAPGITKHPGILIRSGLIVNCTEYLKGLWRACEDLGAMMIVEHVTTLAALASFDAIVVCSGYASHQFPELKHLKIRPIKGQLLEMTWPNSVPPLTLPLNSKIYLVMHPNHKSCYIGATFEKTFSHGLPDIETAREYLLPKACEMFPPLKSSEIIHCQAAQRAATPNHLPFCGQVHGNIWCLTGLGSKGLLYHALFAKDLASQITSKNNK